MKQEMMRVAVASTGSHANHLHHTLDKITMPAPHHSIFTNQMLFLVSN